VPRVDVVLPATLTAPEGAEQLSCDAVTVRELFEAVVAARPALGTRLLFEGRPLVSVVRNGALLTPHLAMGAALADGDRIELLPPVAGG
jgi:molybdopterin converting factor small subunit